MTKKTQKIELIVFDMDGVLYDLDLGKRLALMAKFTGKSEAEINHKIWHSEFELKAEKGFYQTGSAYLEEFNNILGTQLTRSDWLEFRSSSMSPISDMLELCRLLRHQYKIALLTNNGMLVEEAIKQQEIAPAIKDIFETDIYASAELQARKPEKEVYLNICNSLKVRPQEALMVDDKEENILGARDAGLLAHHYQSTAGLKEYLNTIGVSY